MNSYETLPMVLATLEQAQRLLQTASLSTETTTRLETLISDAIADLRKAMGITQWPEPTVKEPDFETLETWLWKDGGCQATDGCWVSMDGHCPHGHPSWLLRLGLI
jgi:hypothetical protein